MKPIPAAPKCKRFCRPPPLFPAISTIPPRPPAGFPIRAYSYPFVVKKTTTPYAPAVFVSPTNTDNCSCTATKNSGLNSPAGTSYRPLVPACS